MKLYELLHINNFMHCYCIKNCFKLHGEKYFFSVTYYSFKIADVI